MTDTTFKREQRYIVFKLTDLHKHLEPSDLFNLQQIGRTVGAGREQDGKAPLECLVVESDWPEYEPTWRAIEQRVSGAALTHPAQPAEGGEAVPLEVIRRWPEGFAKRLEYVWRDLIGFIPSYKLYDLQRVLAEFGFTMVVYEGAPPASQEQAVYCNAPKCRDNTGGSCTGPCSRIAASQEQAQQPSGGGDVLVYAYWPNGERKLLQFHDWPLRHQLPADAVRFDIAWPDDALRNKAPQCPPA